MDDLNREEARLKTFINWPLEWLDKHQLAQTGMFYKNVDDHVKCHFCGVEIGCWEREDQPVAEHLRWSPNCQLLRRGTTNNVPLSGEDLDRVLQSINNDDERRIPFTQIIQSRGVKPSMPWFSRAEATITSTASAATQAIDNGQTQTSCALARPEYPDYAVESARLRTFKAWPRNLKQKPHQLAEAGFFYTGVGDRVRCFSCGGCLDNWDDGDEPWEGHALLLSQCRFVKLIKGQAYVDSVSVKPIPAVFHTKKTKRGRNRKPRNVILA